MDDEEKKLKESQPLPFSIFTPTLTNMPWSFFSFLFNQKSTRKFLFIFFVIGQWEGGYSYIFV